MGGNGLGIKVDNNDRDAGGLQTVHRFAQGPELPGGEKRDIGTQRDGHFQVESGVVGAADVRQFFDPGNRRGIGLPLRVAPVVPCRLADADHPLVGAGTDDGQKVFEIEPQQNPLGRGLKHPFAPEKVRYFDFRLGVTAK